MTEHRDEAGRFLPGHGLAGPGRASGYDEAFCDTVEKIMQAGLSKMAAAGYIGVSYQTLKNWMAEHPAFLAAVKRGEAARALLLEHDLLSATDGPKVTSRIFALKNAAPEEWRDKQELDHKSSDGTMSPPSRIEIVAAQIKDE